MVTALVVAGVVGALAVAAAAALTFTGPGRRLLRGFAQRELQGAVDGTVRVGAVRLLSPQRVEVRDVELDDPAGRQVIAVARLRATVAPFGLLFGRYRFRGVRVVRPVISLVQDSTGRWNVERLFRAGSGEAPSRGPRPLVDIRDARVEDGAVSLRPYGRRLPLRMDGVNVDLRRLRVSDPDSTALVAEVRNLAVRVRDPAIDVKRAAGLVVVDADSAAFRLDTLELPGGVLDVRAVLRTRAGRTAYQLAVNAERFRFEDLAWIAPELPRRGGGTVRLTASEDGEGRGEWQFLDADVRSGDSRVRGALRLVTGPHARVDTVDLSAEPLDLALLAPLLGPMPLHGEVTGRVRGSGPTSALEVAADIAFTDAAVPGRPVSAVSGRGRLAVGGTAGVAFRGFSLSPADVSLATIAGIAPAVTLRGRVRADGTLEGPWDDAAFDGTLTHSDGPGPVSEARGTARLTLGDTTRVRADLALDSLSFDDLARSYTGIPVRGSVAGRVRVDGPVTALALDGDLAGPAGSLVLGGTVGGEDSGAVLRLRGRFEGVDLSRHVTGAPTTALAGSFETDLLVPADSGAVTQGTASVTFDRSRVAGFAVARAGFGLSLGAEAVRLDTLYVEHPGLAIDAAGSLGLPGKPPGEVRVAIRGDTLSALAPIARWLRTQSGDTATGPTDLYGTGRLDGRFRGTTDAWAFEGEFDVPGFAFGDYAALGLRGRIDYRSGAVRTWVGLMAQADSLTLAGMQYGGVRVTTAGPPHAMAARVEASLPGDAPLRAAGELGFDSVGVRVRLDSAAISLPSGAWALAHAAEVLVGADSVTVDSLEFRSTAGGRIAVEGSLPVGGTGDFTLAADSVPVSDLYTLAQQDTAGVGGFLSVASHLTGTASAPTIEAYLTLADGRFGDFRTPLVDGLFRYGDRLLTLKGGLWRGPQRVLAVRGSFPVDLSLTSAERRQLPGPLEIRVQADSVDLSAVDVFTTLVSGVRGVLTADAAVQGSWDQPTLTGQVRISNGAVTIPALGQRLHGIEIRLETSGNRIHLAQARFGGGPGTLDIEGDVVLQDLTRPVLDLTLQLHGFQALNRRDFAGLTGTGTLRLRGPFLGALLTGRLTVDEGYLAFADLVEKRIVNLDDPEFRAVVDSNLAQAAVLGPAPEVVFLDSLRIDSLRVTMGPSVWLRSTEANIQLAGDLRISKSVANVLNPYRLDGTLRAERGTYRLTVGPTSKDFQVTRGEVRFFGTPDLNPQLDIAAEHTVRSVRGADLVVRARIGGTLLEPILTLESDQRPPLSETEIVSYLLFGRPSSELLGGGTGVRSEQAVLQGAVAGLAGIAAGQLEQTLVTDLGLPIDYIAIRPGTVGDLLGTLQVEAGRQIGERTFLSVNAPLCEVRRGQLLGATLAYRLGRAWRLEASVEPVLQECRALGGAPQPTTPYQVGVDLFWQRGIQ